MKMCLELMKERMRGVRICCFIEGYYKNFTSIYIYIGFNKFSMWYSRLPGM